MDGIQAPTGFSTRSAFEDASDEPPVPRGRSARRVASGLPRLVVNGLGLEFPGAIDVNGDSFASLGTRSCPSRWTPSRRIQLITAIGGMEWASRRSSPTI